MATFKTYNVNDKINFTQFGLLMNGIVDHVIRVEADGSAYYSVKVGKESLCVVSSDEIEEGRFSALVYFYKNGKRKCNECCSVEEAWNYVEIIDKREGWKFDTIKRGYNY